MPTFAELKTRVEGYLIDTPSFTINLVGAWINKAIDDAEGRHNYAHMERTLEATTVVDTRFLAAEPSDWKAPRAAPYFLRDDGSTREMAWGVSRHLMRRQFDEEDTDSDGDPEFLLLDENDGVLVYPFPDGNSDYTDGEYRVRAPYWGYSTMLVADGDTNWWTDNWEWYLTFYAAAEGLLANRDSQEATIYIERAEVERQKSMRRSKQKQVRPVRQIVIRKGVYGQGRQPPRK